MINIPWNSLWNRNKSRAILNLLQLVGVFCWFFWLLLLLFLFCLFCFVFLFYPVCNLAAVYSRSHVFMWGQVIGPSSCISILRSFILNFKPDQRDHREKQRLLGCELHPFVQKTPLILSFAGECPLNSWKNFTEKEKRNKYLSFKVFLQLPPTICLIPPTVISDPAFCSDSSYSHVLFCLESQTILVILSTVRRKSTWYLFRHPGYVSALWQSAFDKCIPGQTTSGKGRGWGKCAVTALSENSLPALESGKQTHYPQNWIHMLSSALFH